MHPPARTVTVTLAVCALVAGFCVTLGVLSALRSGLATATRGRGAIVLPNPSRSAGKTAAGQPSPAALDAQWLAYSDRSTCADWAGGDGVSAIRLNSAQVAWFFADTYLGPAGPAIGFSHLSGFVHNSVVVQTATGRGSTLVTLTGGGACDSPGDPGAGAQAVVSPTGAAAGDRDWDADGIRVGGTVLKFYNAYRPGTIPFIPVSTTIASFPVSQLSAAGRGPAYGGTAHPALTQLPSYTPPGGGTPIVWGSALLQAGGTVYIYGWQSPDPAGPLRELYLARAGAGRLTDFGAWQFYDAGQWAGSQNLAQPIEPASQGLDVPAGFSVLRIAGRYWLIQAAGAGEPDIDAYPAAAPWGPFGWDQGIVLYRAPGIGLSAADDYRIMYEARAEPALSTSRTLVISYNVNSEAVTAGCVTMAHYTNAMTQPRFITVPMSVFGPGGRGGGSGLAAGALPRYPAITQQDPAQWFSAWSFPGGCPPVPPVSGVDAQAGDGEARLSWPSAGLGLRYRVYVESPSGTWAKVGTVWPPRITVTGLTGGLTYQFEVVPVNIWAAVGPARYVNVQVP
jgi:hypothetical protein